jgi:hypothetical protein
MLAGGVILLSSGTALALPMTVAKAKVPFAFDVDGHNLPAGSYRIERDDMMPTVLLIVSENGKRSAIFAPITAENNQNFRGTHPTLTFKRDGKEYRLATVRDGEGEGWDVAGR